MKLIARKLNRGGRRWFRAAACGAAMLVAAGAARGREQPARSTPAATVEAAAAADADHGRLPVSPAGEWLAAALDKLDVEHHWLRGNEHIAWRSGLPLLEEHGKKLTPLAKDETHCSAFAAAAADELGIDLLHPPEHSHVLLANAQYDWLPSAEGRKAGWRAVGDAVDAQRLANAGELVVAVFKNPDAARAGHIAIIRPAAETPSEIRAKGPRITQAGFTNYKSADLMTGFNHHPGAWEANGRGGVKFFAHAVTGEDLAGEQ
jgi:hypothetical protein